MRSSMVSRTAESKPPPFPSCLIDEPFSTTATGSFESEVDGWRVLVFKFGLAKGFLGCLERAVLEWTNVSPATCLDETKSESDPFG